MFCFAHLRTARSSISAVRWMRTAERAIAAIFYLAGHWIGRCRTSPRRSKRNVAQYLGFNWLFAPGRIVFATVSGSRYALHSNRCRAGSQTHSRSQTVTNERGTSIAAIAGRRVDTATRFDRNSDSAKAWAVQRAYRLIQGRRTQSQDYSRR